MPTLPQNLGTVTLAVQDDIAVLTLDRPSSANARNQQMRDELVRVYDWIEQSGEVGAMVLTGRGDRYFCAGMDLKEASTPESLLERRERLHRGRDVERLAGLPVGTVAAVNGFAVGGGLEMALACDLRIAVEGAELGLPEVGAGLMPGAGGTQRLGRLVGHARAVEMVLLGDRLSAREAAEVGLINRVVGPAELSAAATHLAGRLAAQPRRALRQAKEALRASLDLPLSQGLDRELDGLLFLLEEQNAGSTKENAS